MASEPPAYSSSTGSCITVNNWGCATNGCCNPSAICGFDNVCCLPCQINVPSSSGPSIVGTVKPTTKSTSITAAPSECTSTASVSVVPTVKSSISRPSSNPSCVPTTTLSIARPSVSARPSTNFSIKPTIHPVNLHLYQPGPHRHHVLRLIGQLFLLYHHPPLVHQSKHQ